MIESNILAHPMTIALFVTFAGMMGWLFKTAIDNGKNIKGNDENIKILIETQADIKEMLRHLTEKQDEQGERLTKVCAEHEMVKSAGNILSQHQKKTTG